MKNLSLNAKKLAFSVVVAMVALSFSAYRIDAKKLADGEFRFYNKSTTINNPTLSQYVYRTNLTMCDDGGPVCNEVWNIGTTTAPADGTLLSTYASPVYVGDLHTGEYNGN